MTNTTYSPAKFNPKFERKEQAKVRLFEKTPWLLMVTLVMCAIASLESNIPAVAIKSICLVVTVAWMGHAWRTDNKGLVALMSVLSAAMANAIFGIV